MKYDYRLYIENKFFTKTQVWSWYGQMYKGLKVIHNLTDYASDTELYLNEDNLVVGGYSFLFNDCTVIKVYEV